MGNGGTPIRVTNVGVTPPSMMGIHTHTHMTTHMTTPMTQANMGNIITHTTHRRSSTHTLPAQEDREEGTMGGRVNMTGTTLDRETMTTGTEVMESEEGVGGTEEEEEE